MRRLQPECRPRIMRAPLNGFVETRGAVMRKMTVWAALIVGCGSVGAAQDGPQVPPGGGGRQGGEGRTVILEQAPKDHSIAIPKDKLAGYLKDVGAEKLQTRCSVDA